MLTATDETTDGRADSSLVLALSTIDSDVPNVTLGDVSVAAVVATDVEETLEPVVDSDTEATVDANSGPVECASTVVSETCS